MSTIARPLLAEARRGAGSLASAAVLLVAASTGSCRQRDPGRSGPVADAPDALVQGTSADATDLPRPQLTDDDLRSIKQRSIGPREMDDPPRIVGYRRSVPVRMRVVCGDLCPDYSVRIVDYVVDSASCAREGGALVRPNNPGGFASCEAPDCIPNVLLPLTPVCRDPGDR